jgi:hypothetical protein
MQAILQWRSFRIFEEWPINNSVQTNMTEITLENSCPPLLQLGVQDVVILGFWSFKASLVELNLKNGRRVIVFGLVVV